MLCTSCLHPHAVMPAMCMDGAQSQGETSAGTTKPDCVHQRCSRHRHAVDAGRMLVTAWQTLLLLFILVSRLCHLLTACTLCAFSCLQAGVEYRIKVYRIFYTNNLINGRGVVLELRTI